MYHRLVNLYFTTATILQWKYLLEPDPFKEEVIDSMRYLVQRQQAVIYAFVIMPNHIHIVWHIPEPETLTGVKAALLSFTAHQFKKRLKVEDPVVLEKYRVNSSDRRYQFWERNPLSIAILQEDVYWQKVQYIHRNPCAGHWQLADEPAAYKYSSAYVVNDAPYWDFVASGD